MFFSSVNKDGTTPNPVTPPEDGAEGISAQDASARAGTLRSTDQPGQATKTTPQTVHVAVGEPPALEPVGHDSRPATKPGGTISLRAWSPEWDQRDTGTHGQMTAGAATPQGEQVPFTRRGNSLRLQPEPWDAEVYEGLRS